MNGRLGTFALTATILGFVLVSAPAHAQCVGDCNGDGMVLVNELILGVNIVLELQPKSACPAFENAQGNVDIAQLVKGVNNALNGCPATPTATVPSTATQTESPESTATATAPPTNTSTAVEPSTPTATFTLPAGTATATVTAPPTETSTQVETSTATETIGTPVDTATATATEMEGAATATATVAETPTPTTTAGVATDTPTHTLVPTVTHTPIVCPASAGRYTQTTTGGVLKVSTFLPFEFPAGGTTIQDVSAGDSNCVHTTVVPYPGGLTVPVFCVPALGYTVQVSQTGCGVGIIDSNGGSDLTTTEKGDSSYNSGGCAVSQACNTFADSSGEIDITVGDGTADTCSSGTGNAMVSIPVNTVTWLSDNGCPDTDGSPSGADDTIITQFPQTLDLTTDRATAQFNDNAPTDGCSLRGAGPAGPYATSLLCFAAGNPYACCTGQGTGNCVGNGAVGTCLDFGTNTVAVAGGGTVFSSAAPLHDLLFSTVQNSTVSAPAASGNATCDSPPTINFAGSAQRCITAP